MVTFTRATEKCIIECSLHHLLFSSGRTRKQTQGNMQVYQVEFIGGIGCTSTLENILTRRICGTYMPVPCPLLVEHGTHGHLLYYILSTLLQSLETSLSMWSLQQENGQCQRSLCDLNHLRWHFVSLVLKFQAFYWFLNLLWRCLVSYLILLKS